MTKKSEAMNVQYRGKFYCFEKDVNEGKCQIEETLGLIVPPIRLILKDHRHVTKLCWIWVSHSLTEDQKTWHVKWCWKMLNLFDKGQSWYANNLWRLMRHAYTTTICQVSLKIKFRSLKMRIEPKLLKNAINSEKKFSCILQIE